MMNPASPLSVDASAKRLIFASYWIVALLAVPLWWRVTSIERLPLPTSRVEAQRVKHLKLPISIYVDSAYASGLVSTIAATFESQAKGPRPGMEHLDVSFKTAEAYKHVQNSPSHYLVTIGSTEEIEPSISVSDRSLVIDVPSIMRDKTPYLVAETLLTLLAPPVPDVQAQYAPRYRIALSLLNEDTSSGGAAMGWDVEHAVQEYLEPTLNQLNAVHNFSIESQVQYYASLTFEPSPSTEVELGYDLHEEHLRTFVNSAEWTLSSSVTNDIVLHLILFIPSLQHRPLRVLKPDGALSSSNSFMLPQWGGITIINPPMGSDTSLTAHHYLSTANLSHPFTLFRAQLLSLLGVSPIPSHVRNLKSDGLSPWQLDALVRRRVVDTAKGSIDTLESIVKLVDKIRNMPVKADVREDVVTALDALDHAFDGGDRSSPEQILEYTSLAFIRSSLAFFNPGMVAMLYFPTEHKYAVYSPLFAPVCLPFLVATIKEIKKWFKERKEQRDEGHVGDREKVE